MGFVRKQHQRNHQLQYSNGVISQQHGAQDFDPVSPTLPVCQVFQTSREFLTQSPRPPLHHHSPQQAINLETRPLILLGLFSLAQPMRANCQWLWRGAAPSKSFDGAKHFAPARFDQVGAHHRALPPNAKEATSIRSVDGYRQYYPMRNRPFGHQGQAIQPPQREALKPRAAFAQQSVLSRWCLQ